jgi:hypothetical protein
MPSRGASECCQARITVVASAGRDIADTLVGTFRGTFPVPSHDLALPDTLTENSEFALQSQMMPAVARP